MSKKIPPDNYPLVDGVSKPTIPATTPQHDSLPCAVELQLPDLQVYRASRKELVSICQHCPIRPYVELQIPSGVKEIHRIVFTTVSHDQGFGGSPESRGTDKGSESWFEAGVSTFAGRDRITSRRFQKNIVASLEFRTHTVSWDLCTTSESHRQWMRRIRSGDSIQIIPKAQFPAWANHVKFAQIELQCSMVQKTNSPICSITTFAKDHTETVETAQNQYQYYQKLDKKELRLVVLHPGSFEDPIYCHLIISPLQEIPAFEALSYCWGDPADTKSIKLSYTITSAPKNLVEYQDFTITTSLFRALKHLRHSDDRSRILWVDSVCINQDDLQERGAQVNMMGEIYWHAHSVCVWLGESNTSSVKAMAFLRAGGSPGRDMSYWDIMEHIPRLFKYPWFGRVWVLQEVWKARKAIVHCGMDSVPWESIIEINRFILNTYGECSDTLPTIWMNLAGVRKEEMGHEVGSMVKKPEQTPCLELLELIFGSISMSATDPRDKIYSLLGMCQETQSTESIPPALHADYTKTPSKTFADFTCWWITEHKSLDILSAIHATTNRTWKGLGYNASPILGPNSLPADHPSWALWHEGDGKWAKLTLGMSGLYKAAGDTVPSPEYSVVTGSQLSLSGLKIGVIASTHPYPFYKAKEDELHEAYIKLFDPDKELAVRDKLDDSRKGEVDNNCYDHYSSHGGRLPSERGRGISWNTAEINSWAYSSFPCHGTPFFRTSNGSVGLCPPMTQTNDIIVVLYGGSVPFILRETGGHGRQLDMAVQYEFIGECFVEGYMHGAAMEKQKHHWRKYGDPQPQKFVLV